MQHWQDVINIEKVGLIHKSRHCILDAWYSTLEDKHRRHDPLLLEALSALLGDKKE